MHFLLSAICQEHIIWIFHRSHAASGGKLERWNVLQCLFHFGSAYPKMRCWLGYTKILMQFSGTEAVWRLSSISLRSCLQSDLYELYFSTETVLALATFGNHTHQPGLWLRFPHYDDSSGGCKCCDDRVSPVPAYYDHTPSWLCQKCQCFIRLLRILRVHIRTSME